MCEAVIYDQGIFDWLADRRLRLIRCLISFPSVKDKIETSK